MINCTDICSRNKTTQILASSSNNLHQLSELNLGIATEVKVASWRTQPSPQAHTVQVESGLGPKSGPQARATTHMHVSCVTPKPTHWHVPGPPPQRLLQGFCKFFCNSPQPLKELLRGVLYKSPKSYKSWGCFMHS